MQEFDPLKKAIAGEKLNFDDIVYLLSLKEDSKEVELLGSKAREIAREKSNKGKIWAAIGLDYMNCRMNCNFCSLGDKWNKDSELIELEENRIMEICKSYIENKADWIVLRTTEFYKIDKLISYAIKIKERFSGDYILTANTGNDNSKNTDLLRSAGFEMVYQAIRLREGEDTNFDLGDRLFTVDKIKKSGLLYSQYLEPIGPEHGNEELAKRMIDIINQKTDVAGIMPRVPVESTPKFKFGALSDKRVAQITAIFRILSKDTIEDIVIHPVNDLAIEYGANVLVVDIGAIPRSSKISMKEWDELTIEKARNKLEKYGYDTKK